MHRLSPPASSSPAPPSRLRRSPTRKCRSWTPHCPGTLPVLNPECVDHAIRTGLALNCDINRVSRFERKHYFYCDMPQGYQITQRLHPVASDGFVELQNPSTTSLAAGAGKQSSAAPPSESGLSEYPEAPSPLRVRVDRIQIEQDSGKNIHDSYSGATMVDLNRAGVGLMEIVFAPDLNSGKDTADVVRKVQLLLRHLGACDANMDEGQLRCDVNVSVTPLPPSAGEWGQAGGGSKQHPSSTVWRPSRAPAARLRT